MSRHRLLTLFGSNAYVDKVMSYAGLTAYWPLNEQSGTVATCLVNPLQNGTYARDVSVMGTGVGIGDGNTAPLFTDTSNDVIDIETATFLAAFDGALFTLSGWIKVFNLAFWTQAGWDRACELYVDANNDIQMVRQTGVASLWGIVESGGITKNVTTATTTLDWFHFAITNDEGANEMKTYFNGTQQGATQAGHGPWAGPLTSALIGAENFAGANSWHGYLSNFSVYDSALAQPQIADLATV